MLGRPGLEGISYEKSLFKHLVMHYMLFASNFDRIHEHDKGSANRPLIIHLPPLSIRNITNQLPVPKALLANTVVQIYPRWSPEHLFPNPIHDTLHAYNWILENLVKQGTRRGPY